MFWGWNPAKRARKHSSQADGEEEDCILMGGDDCAEAQDAENSVGVTTPTTGGGQCHDDGAPSPGVDAVSTEIAAVGAAAPAAAKAPPKAAGDPAAAESPLEGAPAPVRGVASAEEDGDEKTDEIIGEGDCVLIVQKKWGMSP